MVTLVSPFPLTFIEVVWDWLHEHPDANIDDYGPTSLNEFLDEMLRREESGERTWGIQSDGDLVGIVGYAPLTPRLGTLHGICVTQSACGRGIARRAVGMILQELFDSGIEKIMASFFASNARIARFLSGLGFEIEGYFFAHTLQNEKPIDMVTMAKFANNGRGRV